MMAAGGPAGNTRSTRAGTATARPAPSVTVAARTYRGERSEAERPVMTVRRSSRVRVLRFEVMTEIRSFSLLACGLNPVGLHDTRLNDARMQRQQHELCIEALARLQRGLDPALHRQHHLGLIGASEDVGSD